MAKLIFEKRKGWENIYILDEEHDEIGYINNNIFHAKTGAALEPLDLYEIVDYITKNPSREEIIKAHNEALAKIKRLRKRVTELRCKLNKDNLNLIVPGKR